ncbi:hypothetical protein E2C01_023518 [Portunus trituberculatus]|uniref:Uncharacterized protein n=1 Tax=Portunus trituberculatus TaxID=210409 RepID=A0A5B7EA75_PORTR|nr:hypothetical protein [Portunus trituberculatus]
MSMEGRLTEPIKGGGPGGMGGGIGPVLGSDPTMGPPGGTKPAGMVGGMKGGVASGVVKHSLALGSDYHPNEHVCPLLLKAWPIEGKEHLWGAQDIRT